MFSNKPIGFVDSKSLMCTWLLFFDQIMLWVVTPQLIEHGRDPTRCMTFILTTFLVQYVPKVVHTALMVRRLQHVTGYIFGTASSGFFLNLITYFISAHVSLFHIAISGST
jgi:cyclic nucleotide gated channel